MKRSSTKTEQHRSPIQWLGRSARRWSSGTPVRSRADLLFRWGLCTLFLPPLSYLYGLFRLDKAGQAILVALVGWILIWLA